MFLLLEAALFRLPWYYHWVQPNSYTGFVESTLERIQSHRSSGKREVLVVGDSRVGEGFSAPLASAATGQSDLQFWNSGMPGSSPRVWFYYLRDLDPGRNRFTAIVLALDHYSEEDSYDNAPDRLMDLNLALGRLRLTDVWEFSSSMRTPRNQRDALVGSLLKGTTLQPDVREFLSSIPTRLANVRDWRDHGFEYVNGYGGRSQSVHGLSADWGNRTINYPVGLPQDRRDTIRFTVMPDVPPQTGDLTRYRFHWFGKIFDLYRASHTRLILIEMPRAPLPLPQAAQRRETFLDWARKQPHVTIVDPATFRDLETPDTFFDGFHLNTVGRQAFSPRLATVVAAQLSHP